MPNAAEQLAERIEGAVLSASGTFAEGAATTERGMLRTVLGLVREMDLDGSGNFKQTAKNLRTLERLRDSLRGVIITDAYRKRVSSFLGQFPALQGMNDDYLGTILAEAFRPSAALQKAIIDGAIADTEASLIGAGLDAAVIDPIKTILRQNVTAGGSAFDLGEQLREFIIGNEERLGALQRYSGQITRDALNQYSRNYHQAIAGDVGLKWYWYSSGTVDDSREFCVHRNGQYWHIEEIKAWGNLPQWQGRIAGTNSSNIFGYLGGYNCMHGLNAVSEFVVPASAKARAKAKGFE